MRKIIVFISLLFSFTNLFADKSRVMLKQWVGEPGGTPESVSTPVIYSEKESIVEYEFKVTGKTNEHAAIACKISFPNEFEITLLATSEIPTLAIYNFHRNYPLTYF